jgi:hypothetical protein
VVVEKESVEPSCRHVFRHRVGHPLRDVTAWQSDSLHSLNRASLELRLVPREVKVLLVRRAVTDTYSSAQHHTTTPFAPSESRHDQSVAPHQCGRRVRPGTWTKREPMLTEHDAVNTRRSPEPKKSVETKRKPSGLVQRNGLTGGSGKLNHLPTSPLCCSVVIGGYGNVNERG